MNKWVYSKLLLLYFYTGLMVSRDDPNIDGETAPVHLGPSLDTPWWPDRN